MAITANPATWMYNDYPISLQPIVGFIFWHLERGDSLAAATAKARLLPKWQGVDPSWFTAAAQYAARSSAAVAAAATLNPLTSKATVGYLACGGPSHPCTVGLRITLTVQLTNGTSREVSILVDADTQTLVRDVLSTAAEYVALNARDIWGTDYDVELVGAATIVQISGIPWGNPSFVM